MIKTNALSQLLIATEPKQTEDSNRNYVKICLATECVFNTSVEKVDKKYFCNKGYSTSQIVGTQESITVSVDFDSSNEGHKYLYKLWFSDFTECNNQYFKIELPLREGQTSKGDSMTGKCCIQFKNGLPSGAPNELQKLSFDIFPMEIIEKTEGN